MNRTESKLAKLMIVSTILDIHEVLAPFTLVHLGRQRKSTNGIEERWENIDVLLPY